MIIIIRRMTKVHLRGLLSVLTAHKEDNFRMTIFLLLDLELELDDGCTLAIEGIEISVDRSRSGCKRRYLFGWIVIASYLKTSSKSTIFSDVVLEILLSLSLES